MSRVRTKDACPVLRGLGGGNTSWLLGELDQSLEIDFVLSAVQRALAVAQPGIVNSDQGSLFTSGQYPALIQAAGAQTSMDGKRMALYNVFTERLWRTVKYETSICKAIAIRGKHGLGSEII